MRLKTRAAHRGNGERRGTGNGFDVVSCLYYSKKSPVMQGLRPSSLLLLGIPSGQALGHLTQGQGRARLVRPAGRLGCGAARPADLSQQHKNSDITEITLPEAAGAGDQGNTARGAENLTITYLTYIRYIVGSTKQRFCGLFCPILRGGPPPFNGFPRAGGCGQRENRGVA